MLSTVYSPQNKLRRKRSHCGPSPAVAAWGRMIRKQICCGSRCSPSAIRLLGFRRTPRIKSANWSRMIRLPTIS